LIRNPKYKKNKKNKGIVPWANDPRVLYIPIGCKECIECRKQKANEWKIRIKEEIKENKKRKVRNTNIQRRKPKEVKRRYRRDRG